MTTYTNEINSVTVLNNILSFSDIEDELVHFFRNNLTDRQSRALNKTETFIANGSTKLFELTEDKDSRDRHKIMNVKSITVDGETKNYITDFTVGIRKESPILGKIYFWNKQTGTITINYDYMYSFIYPESPRVDLTTNSYPRVSVQIFDVNPTDVAIGGTVTKFDITLIITVIDTKRDYVENISQQLLNFFTNKNIKQGFKNFKYIRNPKLNPIEPSGEDVNDIIFSQEIELEIPNHYVFSK